MNMATRTDRRTYRSLAELERQQHLEAVLMKRGQCWSHNCKVRGMTTIPKGSECDWCGAKEWKDG